MVQKDFEIQKTVVAKTSDCIYTEISCGIRHYSTPSGSANIKLLSAKRMLLTIVPLILMVSFTFLSASRNTASE